MKNLIANYIEKLKPMKEAIIDAPEGGLICIVFHNITPKADQDTLSAATGLWMIFKYLKNFQYHNIRIIGAGKAENRALTALKYYQNILKDDKYKVEFIEDPEHMDPIYCEQLYVVDTDFERTGFKPENFKVSGKIVVLDHHNKLDDIKLLQKMKRINSSNSENIHQILCSSGDENYRASSTSQLILMLTMMLGSKFRLISGKILKEDDIKIIDKSKDFLRKIYRILRAGIQTDSGAFSYSNTDNALLVIGRFLDMYESYGPFEIEQSEFSDVTQLKYTKDDLATLQKLYNEIHISDDEIISLVCDKKDFYYPVFGIYSAIQPVHICQNFKYKACIAIQWGEKVNGSPECDVKVELRSSSEKYNVRNFAMRYGGGGHHQASGFSIKAHHLEFYKKSDELIAAFKKYIREECK